VVRICARQTTAVVTDRRRAMPSRLTHQRATSASDASPGTATDHELYISVHEQF
jgi:hypothetical protein